MQDGGSASESGVAADGSNEVGNDGSVSGDGAPSADATEGGTDASIGPLLRARSCGTVVRYHDTPGHNVYLAGSFNSFSATATPMSDPLGVGTYTATITVDAGLYPYKLVVDGNWILDPGLRYRAYDTGVENSGLRVPNCHEPLLEIAAQQKNLNGSNRGSAQFTLRYTEAASGPGPDPGRFQLVLRTGTSSRALTSSEWSWDAASWQLTISLQGLGDGKYTIHSTASNKSGTPSNTILLPFWVETEAFDWRDALIYMAMVDRFKDGDPTNDPPPTPNAVSSADWKGGDLQGITQSINSGYFDQLGVRALWLSPF
jgi:hypothetical protein